MYKHLIYFFIFSSISNFSNFTYATITTINERLSKAIYNNYSQEAIKIILEGQADINARPTGNEALIHIATAMNRKNIVLTLVNAYVEVDSPQILNKATALHIAATQGYFDIVKILIKKGHANLNAKNAYGSTPLHKAIITGNAAIARYLIKHNAHVNIKNNFNLTPLYLAVNNKYKNYNIDVIVNDLIIAGADVNDNTKSKYLLYYALETDKINTIKILLAHGAIIPENSNKSEVTTFIKAIEEELENLPNSKMLDKSIFNKIFNNSATSAQDIHTKKIYLKELQEILIKRFLSNHKYTLVLKTIEANPKLKKTIVQNPYFSKELTKLMFFKNLITRPKNRISDVDIFTVS